MNFFFMLVFYKKIGGGWIFKYIYKDKQIFQILKISINFVNIQYNIIRFQVYKLFFSSSRYKFIIYFTIINYTISPLYIIIFYIILFLIIIFTKHIMHNANPIIKFTIHNKFAVVEFSQINRKLTRQVDALIQLFYDKCESEFNHLKISWEKGQSPTKQIGLILRGLRKKRNLETMQLNINENNKLEQNFMINLRQVIINNKKTLKVFKLIIGKNCVQIQIIRPIFDVLDECKNLSVFYLKLDKKNNVQKFKNKMKLQSIELTQLVLNLNLQDNKIIEQLNNFFESSMKSIQKLSKFHFTLITKNYPYDFKLKLKFLQQCTLLKTLKLNSSLKNLQFSSPFINQYHTINKINLILTDIQDKIAVSNVFQNLKKISSIQVIKLSFENCQWQKNMQQILLIQQIINCNSSITELWLKLVLEQIPLELFKSILSFSIKSIKLSIFITSQLEYYKFYEYSYLLLDYPLPQRLEIILENKHINHELRWFQNIYQMDVRYHTDVMSKCGKDFRQVKQIQTLSQKLEEKQIYKSVIVIYPYIYSNYDYKQTYLEFCKLRLKRMKVKIEGEFEYGQNSLLININDQSVDFINEMVNIIKQNDVNKLIIYHSRIKVKQVYLQLIQLFRSKIFLTFVNHFMYSQKKKPEYQIFLKPLEIQAEKYNMYLNKINKFHRHFQNKLRRCFMYDIVQNMMQIDYQNS